VQARTRQPLVIAHRGASRDAPENTLAAFRLAVTQRADMIETDLHLTCDGRIVLIHDAELGGSDVTRLTRAEVSERAAEVPTLEEALDAVGGRIPFNLEIKPRADGDYDAIVDAARQAVTRRHLEAGTLWSSFAPEALEVLRRREPAARLGVLVAEPAEAAEALAQARALGADAVHPHLPLVTADLVRALHAVRLAVHVFTVDDAGEMRRLVDLGVEGIFTNVPARLRQLLE
jgi:glycerophosphoryl diester phosphodiesterase